MEIKLEENKEKGGMGETSESEEGEDTRDKVVGGRKGK